MKNLFYFTFILSFISFTSCSNDDATELPPSICKDNYEVFDLENAKATLENGELVITKINENQSDFSFKLRPLTDQYWFNVYYSNLLIYGNRKVTTKINMYNKVTGERYLDRGVTFNSEKMQFHNGNDNIYSQKLFGIGPEGNWNEPDIDTIVSPQPIWPIILGAVAVGTYVLDKYDYKRITKYDADGNVIESTSEHSWNSSAPPSEDGNGNIGVLMSETNDYQFELYNNLLNGEPIENPDPNEPQQVIPVVIDGVEYTCTDINTIRIKDILNGRRP